MKLSNLFGLVTLSLGLFNCGQGPEGLKLLDGKAAEAEADADAELERLEEMQKIVIVAANGTTYKQDIEGTWAQAIYDNCDASESAGMGIAGCSGGFGDCRWPLCESRANNCAAQKFLEMATVASQPIIINANGDKVYAQSAATNAALARQAMSFAAQAGIKAAKALRDARFPTSNATQIYTTSCQDTDSDNLITLGQNIPGLNLPSELAGVLLARMIAESVATYREATQATYDNVLAVADAQLGSGARTDGLKRGVSGLMLSRAEAARLWVGGGTQVYSGGAPVTNGFPGFVAGKSFVPGLPPGGFCSEPELTPQAKAAISVFRTAAVSPVDILAEPGATSPLVPVSIDSLLGNGVATPPPGGSVRQRLTDYWGPYLTAADIQDQFQLEKDDFVQARRYLAQEILAFSRSQTQSVPRKNYDGTLNSTRPEYGGTAKPPEPPSDLFYANLARYDLTSRDYSATSDKMPTATGSFAQFVDYIASATGESLKGTLELDNDVEAAINDAMGLVRNTLGHKGRLKLCAAGTTSVSWVATAQGYAGIDGLILVTGEDGLSCATTGTVEGLPCNLNSLKAVSLSTDFSPPDTGFDKAAYNLGPSFTMTRDTRYYLVKPKLGVPMTGQTCSPTLACPAGSGSCSSTTGTGVCRFTCNNGAGCPTGYTCSTTSGAGTCSLPNSLQPAGSYEALTGITVPVGPALPFCSEVPIVPEAEERAARALRPSEDFCGRSEVSCAASGGVGVFDERMPLENELSDDNDDIESSWRRYLDLARQAANESDALASEYILSGLEDDKRSEEISYREEQKRQLVEGILDELQNTCGTAMDTTRLLTLLSGSSGDSLTAFGAQNATPCPTTACTAGYECVDGACVIDLVGKLNELKLTEPSPDITRLSECLNSGDNESFVHLGPPGTAVCIWRGTGAAANELCKLPTGESRTKHPCPYISPTADFSGCKVALGWNTYADNEALKQAKGIEIVPVSEGLDYFPINQGAFTPPVNECNIIRTARWFPSDIWRDELATLAQTNTLHPLNALEAARKIRFEARLGGYAQLDLGGNTGKFSTGSPWAAAPFTWPCEENTANKKLQPPPFSTCTDGFGNDTFGLFCGRSSNGTSTTNPCAAGNTQLRAAINARMLKATIAAKIIANSWARYDLCPPKDDGEFTSCGDKFVSDSLGIVLPYYGNLLKSDVPLEKRTPSGTTTPILTGGGPLLSKTYALGDGTVYKASPAPFPITPYYSENGAAAGLGNSVYTFVEVGVPMPPSSNTFDHQRLLTCLHTADCHEFDAGNFNLYNLLTGAEPLSSRFTTASLRVPPVLTKGHGCDDANDPGYYPRWDIAGCGEELGVGAIVNGQQEITHFDFTPKEMLDGLELLCEAARTEPCDLGNPPKIETVDDLPKASRFLGCVANVIRNNAGLTVFANMPAHAKDALRKESVLGTYPELGGDLQQAVSNIRTGLVGVYRVAPLISNELEQLGADLKEVHNLVAQSENRAEIADVQFMSQTADRIADCATVDVSTFGFNNLVRCTNAIAQIHFASRINDLTEENERLNSELAINTFTAKFSERATRMQGYSTDLTAAIEGVDSGIAAFEAVQQRAKRTLARALYASSFHAKNEVEVTSAIRKRLDVAKIRYERAHMNAQRWAFLAKRAIETRLGMRLSQMTEDLPLVAAPNTWESTVCATSPLDYNALSEAGPSPVYAFADAYIGQYVTNLENLVESYRLKYGFHEGEDTAVISLRDDVMNVREECEVDSGNLLYHAGQLDSLRNADTAILNEWSAVGCRKDTTVTPNVFYPDCINARPKDTAAFPSGFPTVGSAFAYDIDFGTTGALCPSGNTCGLLSTSKLVQSVSLQPGKYRFSWYLSPAPASAAATPALWVVEGANGTPTISGMVNATPSADTWARPYVDFTVTNAGLVSVGFKQPVSGTTPSISVSAPMLEQIEDQTVPTVPGVFMNTSDTLTNFVAACEDSDGNVFRQFPNWKRGCVLLCKDGFNGTCAGNAQEYCYQEAKFNISQRSIEHGDMLGAAGFAKGNFNYRIDSLALNFVGTGTRDCSDSQTPSACYGGGFIPYSLEHIGPYYVRNHLGQDYLAKLFDGNIEHARGLAAERYITNPLSSADRELLGDYMREELRGRPMDGTFLIRVWEEPGVDFSSIDDVQVVLKYRYWTRFD